MRLQNESYSLAVALNGSATLTAPTVWGALRGLETLSQLVSYDFLAKVYRIAPVLPLVIDDEPRFPHRGLMLDCGRHFLPISQLESTINALTYAKMNVLHLHLTESGAISIDSHVFQGFSEPREGF